jgi:ABC-2 type transport system ATP-binding protein
VSSALASDEFRRSGLSKGTATDGGQRVTEVTSTVNQARTDGRTAAAVEAEGLVKTYRSRTETIEAVRGVDLRVEAGEVFGFLGPNGAGKSTTVRMLTTLLSITAGTARVMGLDVGREPDAVRRQIGVALQEAGLDSGGMKRRLDLASALVQKPEVLFLDEPTTGLDPVSRLTVWDEVRRINERGTTVFLTTQYLEEADQLCDRLAIIDDGRVVREGTPSQLKAELRQRLRLAREVTLDDVFLDATGRTRMHVEGEVQEVSA